MFDAIDLALYRQTGEVRIEKEKFVENFIRRFAESADLSDTYKIQIYDVNETPPKVSIKVSSSKKNNSTGKVVSFNITNNLDGIIETRYKKKVICTSRESRADEGVLREEYNCDVGPGEKYVFYVLKRENGKVKLIMNRNLTEIKRYANPVGEEGVAENRHNVLNILTENWSEDIDEIELPKLKDLVYLKSNHQAVWDKRLEEQASFHLKNKSDYYYDLSEYGFLYTNLRGPYVVDVNYAPLAYWLEDTLRYSADGDVSADIKGMCMYSDGRIWVGADRYSAIECGIRPVITISEDEIEL